MRIERPTHSHDGARPAPWSTPTPIPSPEGTALILAVVGDAIACYDTNCARVWCNPAFDALLQERPGFVDVDRRLAYGARELAARRGATLEQVAPDYCGSGEFPAPAAGFSTRAVFLPATNAGERDTVMVILTTRSVQRQLEAWRDRYRLTPRELEVTGLLLHGRSNAEIAESLRISRHTARHHTERVLDKLGVRSRAAVSALLRAD